ncbi:phosphogluconate dehydrogenase (NADP(+)-dependent, decarboxylating) [Mucilaginibacter sp. PPCGB 2223]|uniref:NADP-dependent phosphogluconate dehydrogenase n=1 Tax=Mucilaginibacter sp. PPCGB 2223 TaxID=1886027 RepID=UPI000824DAE5|nr:NADP-dependent phosphogluconate dehydrogenase [Mucilaginibacter sp. PPCGB 2223]OCX53655.1 phosphogluconate dehydrogenase (NADP(+)-dependent, decarboxylating) [Mucilaginibacter sp. PPCGB 2223]
MKYDFGMIGLGTMGRNLLLNMADHGVNGAGFDKDASKGVQLEQEAKQGNVKGFSEVKPFIESLNTPRAVMMLVPAGKIVDEVIEELIPFLDKGDILIDGGNSHFTDTNRRVDYLESKGFHFFGMGVSGGEEGARKGPSMMPGGDKEAYNVMKPILESIAAKVEGAPCVTYIGPGASGHFVKMVHNGIEYALMQLIAETYEILRNGLSLSDTEIHGVFEKWNAGRLSSFLIEITRDIFTYKEPGADHLLVNDIKDEARAKGTGKWTSQEAMNLETPIPSIDSAVSMRDLSKYKAMRTKASEIYGSAHSLRGYKHGNWMGKEDGLKFLEEAYFFSMIITYAQGMHMLSRASVEYKYDLHLDEIAKIWRGGCIIRSTFLENIYSAYSKDKNLEHLLLDADVANLVKRASAGMRNLVAAATSVGIAIPAYAASLSYFDNFRTENMPSNLTQAQRDYFGAHTYALIGKEGVFHTQWMPK